MSFDISLLNKDLLLEAEKHAKCVNPIELSDSRSIWLHLKEVMGSYCQMF